MWPSIQDDGGYQSAGSCGLWTVELVLSSSGFYGVIETVCESECISTFFEHKAREGGGRREGGRRGAGQGEGEGEGRETCALSCNRQSARRSWTCSRWTDEAPNSSEHLKLDCA